MKDKSLQVAQTQAASTLAGKSMDIVGDLVKSPIAVGFIALMANHALYKKGWYSSDSVFREAAGGLAGFLGFTREVSQTQAAINMHDSVAIFIMTAGIVGSIAQGVGGLGNIVKAIQ